MKHLFAQLAGLCALVVVAGQVVAADQHAVTGVVVGVKSADKKITISHGPIKGLGMDGMSMDFKVYDPAMLSDVSEGHKVAFVLEKDASGALVITEIEDQGVALEGEMPSHEHNHDH